MRLISILFATLLFSCTNNKPVEVMEQKNMTLETIHSRKSVRSYSEKPVSEENLITLVKAGMAAPTGKDRRPWEFVIITERASLDVLASKLPYAKMLTAASSAIVVCGNDNIENGGSPYWYLDCSAAAQNILLAAESLGLGAVWTAAYPYEERMQPVAEVLNLPDNIKPLCVIPIGYPRTEQKTKDKFNKAKIHINKW